MSMKANGSSGNRSHQEVEHQMFTSFGNAETNYNNAMAAFAEAAKTGNQEGMLTAQTAMQAATRIMTAISEMLKMAHDTAMALIRNLKS